MEAISKLVNNHVEAPTLSPIGEMGRPGSLLFEGAQAYESLFSGPIVRRSPAQIRRAGLLDRFLFRSSLRKIESDLARRFDISVVLYPMGMDLAAWGLVVDRVGRVFEIFPRPDGLVELLYQGGCCRTKREWKMLVGTRRPDDEQQIRLFYNTARRVADDRIAVVGTVGFGLWDALWMSFDFEPACHILEDHVDFAKSVIRYWADFHLGAVKAMLDAGVKIISFREHPDGYPAGAEMVPFLDSFLGEHLRDIAGLVHSRGGYFLLDCDADDLLHSDQPLEWGFDGIGPLMFRDQDDLQAASASLDEDLVLVAALLPRDRAERPKIQTGRRGKVILAPVPEYGFGAYSDNPADRAALSPLLGTGT